MHAAQKSLSRKQGWTPSCCKLLTSLLMIWNSLVPCDIFPKDAVCQYCAVTKGSCAIRNKSIGLCSCKIILSSNFINEPLRPWVSRSVKSYREELWSDNGCNSPEDLIKIKVSTQKFDPKVHFDLCLPWFLSGLFQKALTYRWHSRIANYSNFALRFCTLGHTGMLWMC